MNSDYRATKLYRAVAAARSRLRFMEEKHDSLLAAGNPEVSRVSLEYAAAVQEHTNAVMAWLVVLHGQRQRAENPPPDSARRAATGAGEG